MAPPREGLVLLAAPLVMPRNMIPPIRLSLITPDTGYCARIFAQAGIAFDRSFAAWHASILPVIMDSGHWAGLATILFAGPSPACYQAVAIDRASRWRVFGHISYRRWPA